MTAGTATAVTEVEHSGLGGVPTVGQLLGGQKLHVILHDRVSITVSVTDPRYAGRMSVTPTPKQSDDNLPAPTDWDSDYDTGRVTAWWRIDDNPEWVVLLAFASFAGVVELVEQTALYVGAATDKQVADQVTARARGTHPRPTRTDRAQRTRRLTRT